MPGDQPDFQISFLNIAQTTYTSPTCKVAISFRVTGPATDIDIVQVYAVNAANTIPSGLGDLVDTVDLMITEIDYSSVVDLQAGAAYIIGLCPRSETDGVPDDQLDEQYWESFCIFRGFVTYTTMPPPAQKPPPRITSLQPHPATMKDDPSITVTWEVSQTIYQSFLIRWSQGLYSRAQGEVDFDNPSATGSWTATPVFPGDVYTFAVNGGTYGGIHGYNYYDWGPTVKIVAPQNLTSLRQFLSFSGVNPAGAHLRPLMSPGTSLRKFMKLS